MEASKGHLGPKTVIVSIFDRLKKKSGIWGVHLGTVFISKIDILGGSKRVSNIKLILKAILHRFWDDFRGPGNVKNEQKRGRVVLFLIFGGCNIRRHFGAVLEGFGQGFWELFGRFWLDFGALKGVQF